MYKIRGADQKEYGPVTGDVVRQWIAERRANAQTYIQGEGSTEWKPLAEFPEFQAALASAPIPAVPPVSAAPVVIDKSQQSKAMAVTSLILGILSLLCLGFLAGIPAIIMGHIAHSRARRNPARFGSGGLAMAAFIMGYIGTLLCTPVHAAFLLPALAKAKSRAQQIECVNHLKQIALAARMYANDHSDQLPPDFQTMSNELGSPKILVCPGDRYKTVAPSWASLGPDNISYEFDSPGAKLEPAAPQTVIFDCPIHGSEALADGSVLRRGRMR